ncbi:MAG: molecular chaperone TorD family protein [Planctomycetota bacterium]|jgi:nitrate reductase assembly molybdenum cofactor insertion protein NarJ|nr:hypothetical protein [Planctomycetota bacterium]MDP6849427.1 molecular chaperone TorD family protein [Planctomycetota bacterium]MDP6941467.1 molecular chaperone TorD family protein [Planctomycetota bacterium]MDP7245614.1 molecular chaperone TorD family protein [Planctomycetota bacterium]HJM39792.1 molecular chaperone TorD family protein [Planctomycetota bacterium]|tara:strand:+ start:6612 stop:7151 length:540 start_codon:yes stop_codon:yes gene_type:complete
MKTDGKVYDALSKLVTYPRPGFGEAAEEWIAVVANASEVAKEALQPFTEFLKGKSDEEMEELFARTFDNSASAALETGWHVFGEAYERGGFLVKMRELLRENEITEGSELPDHLCHVMAVLARCDDVIASELSQNVAIPAVKKICVSLAANDNPYEPVLDAVLAVLNMHVQETNGNPQS